MTAAFLLLALALPLGALAQSFRIAPAPDVLFAQPLEIALAGFAPGSEVEVTAERSMRLGSADVRLFRASARFRADASGQVELGKAAPISGSYLGVDPMGLFWSMTPTADAPGAERYSEIRIAARAKGRAASAVVHIDGWLPAVQTRDVPEFPGAVFASLPGAERRPALILLHGSDGGSGNGRAMAPMFASRGYAVLSLPYYSPPDASGARELEALPGAFADIPVDRLELGRDWLARQPNVDAARIGLWGYSKGAEFALLAAAQFPWIKAVVASAPSDVVWEGWGPGVAPGTRPSFAFRGTPYPFVPYDLSQKNLYGLMSGGRRAHPDRAAAARIAVERYRGALLVAGAGKDETWESSRMAQAIAERRAEAGLDTALLVFPEAGHGLTGDPWLPKGEGETAAAESRAQRETWAAIFAFFERTLR